MSFGIMLKQRDIVLIPISFTDPTSQKRHPAVVISSNNYNETHENIVVAALTSNIESHNFATLLTSDDLEHGVLKATSMIRADKIYTLERYSIGEIYYKNYFKEKPYGCTSKRSHCL